MILPLIGNKKVWAGCHNCKNYYFYGGECKSGNIKCKTSELIHFTPEVDYIKIEDLEKQGHSYHCAYRQIYGDGECECDLYEKGYDPDEWMKVK